MEEERLLNIVGKLPDDMRPEGVDYRPDTGEGYAAVEPLSQQAEPVDKRAKCQAFVLAFGEPNQAQFAVGGAAYVDNPRQYTMPEPVAKMQEEEEDRVVKVLGSAAASKTIKKKKKKTLAKKSHGLY